MAHRPGIPQSSPQMPLPVSHTTLVVSESSPSVPSVGSELSWPSCCLTNDPSSDIPSLKYGCGSTSGSESCRTTPPTPSEVNASLLGNNSPTEGKRFNSADIAPTKLAHFNLTNDVATGFTLLNSEQPLLTISPTFPLQNYSPVNNLLQLPSPSRSHRYTPYPQAIQMPSMSYTGPSIATQVVHPADPAPIFDPDTLALWNQFLQDDTTNASASELGSITNTADTSSLPHPLLNFSPCSCKPGSSCATCSPNTSYVPSASVSALIPNPCSTPCTEFDCSTLAAAMALIDEDFPAVDECPSSAFPSLPGLSFDGSSVNQLSSDPLETVFPPPTSSHGDDATAQLLHNPKPVSEQSNTHPVVSSKCTCGQKCSCFFCRAEPSSDPVSGKIPESLLNCAFCNGCRALEQALVQFRRTAAQTIP